MAKKRKKAKQPKDHLVRHCWADGPLTDDGCSTTCFLPAGHDGPHEWTRDDEITIAFAAREER